MTGLTHTKVRVTHADPVLGTVWAQRPLNHRSWGEKIMIFVQALPNNESVVTVQSSLAFGGSLIDWGANERNIRDIFGALERVLSSGPQNPPAGPL
jgi:hypothetical protein